MSRKMSENCNLIGLPKSKTADSAQPRYRSIVTRPFSLLVRAGSGHETIKAEEIAISQVNTSLSKASTDINLAECPETERVHGESFKVTKKSSEENWTLVVPRRRTKKTYLQEKIAKHYISEIITFLLFL